MKTPTRSLSRPAALAVRLAVFAALGSPLLLAQDSSGNGLLPKGSTFRYRYVGVVNTGTTGAVIETTASEGVITFNGDGTYTISTGSQWVDNTVSGIQTIPASALSGFYTINAAGIGTFSNPDPNPNLPNFTMYGSFSQGVITASSTETGSDQFGDELPGVNDLFVAIAVGPVPTNSTFTSPYWIGALDFAEGVDADLKNALFEITPNGSGSLGALSIQGQANNANGTLLTQNVSGATYNFASDGNAQFTIPAPTGVTAPQVLVSGPRNMYVSADGNFMLGWTANGYDLLFGVKALPSSVAGADALYTGVYYLGGLGDLPTVSGMPNCGPYSFWGSENADGNENEVVHQRLYWPQCANFQDQNGYPLPYDFGTWDETLINSNGTAADSPLGFLLPFGSNIAFGDTGGNCVPSAPNTACAFVAIDNPPMPAGAGSVGSLGLTIGIHAPNFSGSGLFLNPIGVVNAASYDPVTASVAPGEFLTLFGSFGTNLPKGGLTASAPFSTTLGPIQVLINGQAAPIYYASASQINVIAPFELADATTYTASIQVNNNNLSSNTISVYLLTDANPGIFSYGPNGDGNSDGIGYAIAEHANGALVTPSNPAQPGETIVLGLGGLGTVTPAVADGAIPPSSPLSYVDDYTNSGLFTYFHDYDNGVFFQTGNISFAGLYPGFPGEYQMNVVVPTTVGPGNDIFIEVISPFAERRPGFRSGRRLGQCVRREGFFL